MIVADNAFRFLIFLRKNSWAGYKAIAKTEAQTRGVIKGWRIIKHQTSNKERANKTVRRNAQPDYLTCVVGGGIHCFP